MVETVDSFLLDGLHHLHSPSPFRCLKSLNSVSHAQHRLVLSHWQQLANLAYYLVAH